jgi:hypothetical protein
MKKPNTALSYDVGNVVLVNVNSSPHIKQNHNMTYHYFLIIFRNAHTRHCVQRRLDLVHSLQELDTHMDTVLVATYGSGVQPKRGYRAAAHPK